MEKGQFHGDPGSRVVSREDGSFECVIGAWQLVAYNDPITISPIVVCAAPDDVSRDGDRGRRAARLRDGLEEPLPG
jgi:hypothetical protein